jgi:methionyl-tRNA formyltransferase
MEAIYDVGGKLVFAGTLLDSQATNKSGRVFLDEFCARREIPLAKFRNINDPDAIASIRAAELDWLMIIGWSQIARDEVLASARCGVLGMHPSLLPVGRGRAAVPWAILLDLPETGVSLFKLDGGIDTGPVVAQLRLPLSCREDATSLYERVNAAHRALIMEAWKNLQGGELALHPQDSSQATVWEGRTPEQGRLVPSMSVEHADRLIRAVTRPYPGAFIDIGGRRLRIWKAEPGDLEIPPYAGPETALVFDDGWLRIMDSVWETLVP